MILPCPECGHRVRLRSAGRDGVVQGLQPAARGRGGGRRASVAPAVPLVREPGGVESRRAPARDRPVISPAPPRDLTSFVRPDAAPRLRSEQESPRAMRGAVGLCRPGHVPQTTEHKRATARTYGISTPLCALPGNHRSAPDSTLHWTSFRVLGQIGNPLTRGCRGWDAKTTTPKRVVTFWTRRRLKVQNLPRSAYALACLWLALTACRPTDIRRTVLRKEDDLVVLYRATRSAALTEEERDLLQSFRRRYIYSLSAERGNLSGRTIQDLLDAQRKWATAFAKKKQKKEEKKAEDEKLRQSMASALQCSVTTTDGDSAFFVECKNTTSKDIDAIKGIVSYQNPFHETVQSDSFEIALTLPAHQTTSFRRLYRLPEENWITKFLDPYKDERTTLAPLPLNSYKPIWETVGIRFADGDQLWRAGS